MLPLVRLDIHLTVYSISTLLCSLLLHAHITTNSVRGGKTIYLSVTKYPDPSTAPTTASLAGCVCVCLWEGGDAYLELVFTTTMGQMQ